MEEIKDKINSLALLIDNLNNQFSIYSENKKLLSNDVKNSFSTVTNFLELELFSLDQELTALENEIEPEWLERYNEDKYDR